MKNRAVILMYHRVVDSLDATIDYSPDGMIVTFKAFEKQMKYLAKNYKIVSLKQLVIHLERNGKLPNKLCTVTFDDGWKEVYDYQVLRKY